MLASAVMTIGILMATRGHFEYSLDDPYIHLRLSQMIASGTYGINPGQPASPSSSILWPFLLVPFVGTWFHQYVPLVISILSLVGALLISFRGLSATWESFDPTGFRRVAAILVAALYLNWFGLPFTGMEQSLHVLTAVACASGLLLLVHRGTAPWWLWASLILGPAVRYEGIAVSGVTLLAVVALGRWRQALAVGAVMVVPIGAFSAFLVSQGLPVLPDSVVAKWGPAQGRFSLIGQLRDVTLNVVANIVSTSPVILLFAVCLSAAIAIIARARREGSRDRRSILLLAAVGVLGLHLAFGHNGWFARYEIYALSYACILLFGALGSLFRLSFRTIGVTATLLIGATFGWFGAHQYVLDTLSTPTASQANYDRQHQMHVFAVDYLRAPVAVNDIGEVSYNNPFEVVDLWGLGSDAALRARLSGSPDWIAGLVDPSVVPAAMIYTDWFGEAIPSTWVKVGTISANTIAGLGEAHVDVYSTSRTSVPRVTRALIHFRSRVPAQTRVVVEQEP